MQELTKIDNVEVQVINSSNIRGTGMRLPWKVLRLLWELQKKTRVADAVSLHLSPLAIPKIGPFALAFCWLHGKPLILRLFGGQDFRDFPGIGGWLHRQITKKCDVYLAQTERLVQSAQRAGVDNPVWYPTSRPDADACSQPARTDCRRFIYLGWIKESKGVPLILKAGEQLPQDISVDVYGPFDGMSEADFHGSKTVKYCGVLAPGDGTCQDFRIRCAGLTHALARRGVSWCDTGSVSLWTSSYRHTMA